MIRHAEYQASCKDPSDDFLVLTGCFPHLSAQAGGCFVPLDPSYPPDRLANCMEDAEPVLLVSTVRHAELARSLSSSCPSTREVGMR